ncbi:hypothetical protein QDR63_18820 [Acinetobacter baumannii]|uniref:hypothetical protein n=1 Tax=Acinetobacter baumannii TaxID=470 RepID=UPI002449F6B7|nr:hypothetical protein [Acinetobacter baumannii]MDH2528313.1 hypothetical protein [Acinetobacter baumannii]
MEDKDEKWAVNIAFVAQNKETARLVLDFIDSLEDDGKIEDSTGIHGPFDSLQLMLKRRAENLALDVKQLPTEEDDE